MDPAKSKTNDKQSSKDIHKSSSTFDSDAELLGISISSQPTEKITENVDDLVSDLETLLGESTDSFAVNYTTPKEKTLGKRYYLYRKY
mgnify:FL=1